MSRAKRADTVVKFPIDRVVREHRIGMLLGVTIEAEAIDQALRSVRHAIKSLRRQEATLNLCAARARKKVTPEQQAAAVKKNMRHIYACQDEDRAAAAPPPDAGTRRALRKLVDKWDAEAGEGDDGGNAA